MGKGLYLVETVYSAGPTLDFPNLFLSKKIIIILEKHRPIHKKVFRMHYQKNF